MAERTSWYRGTGWMQLTWAPGHSAGGQNAPATSTDTFFRRAARPIALARVLLALGNVLVIYLDPSLPIHKSWEGLLTTYANVVLMLAYSVWVWQKQSTPSPPGFVPRLATGLDVLFTASLVASTGAHTSPFYMWNVFTIVGCALKHGWQPALGVSLVQIALYVGICIPHSGHPDFVIGVFVVRTSFLFVITLVLAYMGQQLLEQNRMLAGLHSAASHMSAGRSTEDLLGRIADSLTDLLEVERGVVAVWPAATQAVPPALVNMDREQSQRLIRLVTDSLSAAGEPAAPIRLQFDDPTRMFGPGAEPGALDGIRSLLVACLPGSRGWAGILIACNRRGRRGFTAMDHELAELLAGQAGPLLETSRLQELRRYHAGLDERRRIAGELHDGLIQTLASIDIRALTCGELCRAQQWAPLTQELRTLKQLAEEALEEARGAISELAPVRLQEGGLAVYLQDCISQFRDRVSLQVAASIDLEATGLPEPTALLLIGLLREGLNNTRKHARATQVTITIWRCGGEIRFRLVDDGGGFDPETCLLRRAVTRQYGLAYLRQRTAQMGGELRVTSRPGAGTALEARVPILTEEALVDLLSRNSA